MKTIGVFFGSRSTEHDISIITAQMTISGLKGLGYEVIPIYIDPVGQWRTDPIFGKLKSFVDQNGDLLKKGQKLYLDLEKSKGKLVFKNKGLAGKELAIDLAFPTFHGNFGEDGTIQGLFEMFSVPYVGCGVVASAIAMDKAFTKQICASENLPITKFVTFSSSDWERHNKTVMNRINEQLAYPVIIKPVHLGSSIGISKATSKEEMIEKIEVALFYDDKVLVEICIEDLMDVTCCVIGNNDPIASELQESVFKSELFSFDDKYLTGGGSQLGKSDSGLFIPARLNIELTDMIKTAAMKVYAALGCTGIARVDFLLNKKTRKFYVNEVNPLPGTLYHHLWAKSGIELPELLEKLIGYAEDNAILKNKIISTFKSSVLTNLKSAKLSKGSEN